MRRLSGAGAVLVLAASAVALPTINLAGAAAPTPRPVTPRVQTIAVAKGVSPAAAAEAQPMVAGRRVGALTAALPTSSFSLVGASWQGAAPAGMALSVRTRSNGTWSDWKPLSPEDAGPDPSSAEGRRARQGTEPLVTGTADGVQLRAESGTGAVPTGLQVDLVDSPTSSADATPGQGTPAGSAAAAAAMPTIYTRAQWGADESMRNCTAQYSSQVLGGAVHHTVSTNTYSAADTASVIRGIYAYHTQSLGWCDIGYNFLVDRFGRIWEGRAGGMASNVIGAHTIGFNEQTFGVSAIGDFQSAQPPAAVTDAIARVMAWKMGLNHIDPTGTAVFTSAGNTSYAAGAQVRKYTLSGHRDFWGTECPGQYLYAKLPALRTTVKSLIGQVPTSTTDQVALTGTTQPLYGSRYGLPAVTATFADTVSWTLDVLSPCSTAPVTTWSGTGPTMSQTFDGTDSTGAFLPPGAYTLRLSRPGANPWSTTVEIVPTAASPLPTCRPTRLAGAAVESVSDGVRRVTGATKALVVVASESQYRVDQVGAGPLAAALDAGVVATPSNSLSPALASRIDQDGVKTAYLLGRSYGFGWDLVDALTARGVKVVYVGGANQYAVAASAAGYVAAVDPAAARTVTIVAGDPTSVTDAAAGGAVGASLHRPVLVVSSSGVPAETAAALTRLGARAAVVVGRTAAIPDAVVTALRSRLPAVQSVRGADTATTLVNTTAAYSGLTGLQTVVLLPFTSGDGLESVLASALGRPALLEQPGSADALAPVTRTYLLPRAGEVDRLLAAAPPAKFSTALLVAVQPYTKAAS